MGDDRKCMYDGWRKNGAHSREWVDKTKKFADHAFSLSNIGIARCPCSKCQNGLSHDKRKVSIQICRFGYMSGYEVWVHHGEEVPENEPVAEDDMIDEDRIDEMLNAIEGPDKATRGGGGEREPIKILHMNSAYVPKLIQHAYFLTRSRPPNYRQAISSQNRVRKPKPERKHKIVLANPRPANPPTSHEDRLAADWVKKEGTAPHYNSSPS
jgi:hypothetical protein